jgi:hypothetical protein
MPMVSEVERIGYALLRGLDRLGFVHETHDGNVFTVRFSRAMLYGDAWAVFNVDAERLYHFSVADLSKSPVLSQLSAVVHKPVRAVTNSGMIYAVELNPRPKTKLPTMATLDLSTRPAGDLMIPLGVGRHGPRWESLTRIKHAMIAGATDSGKSTFIHSALAALLTTTDPLQLRVALIDPKRSELTAWAKVPHLLKPIATTPDAAADILSECVMEMDQRGDAFAAIGVRDIVGYHRQGRVVMPYILAMIDEALDLADEKRVMEQLKAIAIRGRSAGIFVWCATQHGAAITGLPRVVNVNLSSRFVFRVTDESASRAALGVGGAENISPAHRGRMYAKLDTPELLQGFYLSDDELSAITRGLADGGGESPKLSEGEAALVRFAIKRLGGRFIKNALVAAFAPDWTDHKIKTLAAAWERKGWLTKPTHRAEARTVVPELACLAGLSDVAHASPTQMAKSPTPVIACMTDAT